MISKFYKFQSLNIDLLKNYKYIIWMDASAKITNKNFVNDILNLINLDKDLYIYENATLNTIRSQAIFSSRLIKYENHNLTQQVKDYIKNGLIDQILYETGFLLYKNSEKVKNLMNDWWKEVCKYVIYLRHMFSLKIILIFTH